MRLCAFGCAVSLVACSAALPPPSHVGWSLRYIERSGSEQGAPETRPEIRLTVLDGVGRVAAPTREVYARFRHGAREAELCHAARCQTVDAVTAFVGVEGLDGLAAPPGAQESEPTVELQFDDELVANVRTQGGRFVSALRGPAGAMGVEVLVRWIDGPGGESVEAAKGFFLAPLRRMGATRLADAIARAAGLPLRWEVRIRNTAPGGEARVGTNVHVAAEIGNPPERL